MGALVAFFELLGLGFLKAQSQYDTLTVFQYNILYYGNSSGFCNSSNNNVQDKDANLRTILRYVQPDVIGFNEIAPNQFYIDNLTAQVVNEDSLYKNYKAGAYSNNGFSNLVNAFFYNEDKLGLVTQDKIDKDPSGNTLVRVLDVYTLYYKDSLLSIEEDTSFITFIVVHFKAGTSGSDGAERAQATAAVMKYLNEHPEIENSVLMGDFNMKSSTANAYKNLINNNNSDVEFIDPIEMPGNWNNSSSFAAIHTQSTRISSNTNGGCYSGGGMDDRFDLIMCNNRMLEDSNDVKFIKESYNALGQDGMRLNETITFPTNNSVPTEVSDALFNTSDHLPVVLDLIVERIQPDIPDGISSRMNSNIQILNNNPVIDRLSVKIRGMRQGAAGQLQLFSITGGMKDIIEFTADNAQKQLELDLSDYPIGVYFMKISSGDFVHIKKIIKK